MSAPYRILVTGSRDWPHLRTVYGALDIAATEAMANGHDRIVVVHGACRTGADVHAHMWATKCGATQEPHPADWKTNGKAAGPLRNARMVGAGADLCLAFIKGGSRGASHTAGLAEAAGITTRRWTA